MRYFEDLEIGAETYFGSYEVTREEVLEFARKYDPQYYSSIVGGSKLHGERNFSSGAIKYTVVDKASPIM